MSELVEEPWAKHAILAQGSSDCFLPPTTLEKTGSDIIFVEVIIPSGVLSEKGDSIAETYHKDYGGDTKF